MFAISIRPRVERGCTVLQFACTIYTQSCCMLLLEFGFLHWNLGGGFVGHLFAFFV